MEVILMAFPPAPVMKRCCDFRRHVRGVRSARYAGKGRWRISFLTNPLPGHADLTRNDLSELANHPALLSLHGFEIEVFLHDTAQTELTRPGSVGPAALGTLAQSAQGAAHEEWEGLSSARARKAGGHSESAGRPRVPFGARRRGRRVPFARWHHSPQPGSWHVLPQMQYTVLFVRGLKGTMSEAELHILKQRMYQGRLRPYPKTYDTMRAKTRTGADHATNPSLESQ